MALQPGAFFLNVTFNDSGDNRTTRTYEMDVADDAAAATAAAAMLATLATVSDAKIISYFYAQRFYEDTNLLPTTPCEVENQAILTYSLAGQVNKTATNTIPAPTIGIFVDVTGANRNIIDTTDAAVIAFRSHFQTAGDFFISDGEKVNVLKKGKRRHVKNSNG